MNEYIQSEAEKPGVLKLTNHIQLLLADDFYGFSSDESQLAWIEKYSKQFREIVAEHPELLAEFEKDQLSVLEYIKKLLY